MQKSYLQKLTKLTKTNQVIVLPLIVFCSLYTQLFSSSPDKTFLDRDVEYPDTILYKVVLHIKFLLHGMYCLDSVLIASYYDHIFIYIYDHIACVAHM